MSEQNATPAAAPQDENQLIAERREKLKTLRQAQAEGKGVAFPNDFKPQHHAEELHGHYGETAPEALNGEGATKVQVSIAGRMMLKRVMGKACFGTLQDATGRIQVYVTLDNVGAETLNAFKHWDLGDIVGVEGHLFKTRTGELSIHATGIVGDSASAIRDDASIAITPALPAVTRDSSASASRTAMLRASIRSIRAPFSALSC